MSRGRQDAGLPVGFLKSCVGMLRVDCDCLGVISLELGPALDMDRTKGYDMGIVLVVENKEALGAWASDPAHLR